jgi:hypothetical protein
MWETADGLRDNGWPRARDTTTSESLAIFGPIAEWH